MRLVNENFSMTPREVNLYFRKVDNVVRGLCLRDDDRSKTLQIMLKM